MELFLPDQIVLNDASRALLGDVEETARRVNEYRPLPPAVVKRIVDGLLGDRVYSSNAIEGSTLDYRETVAVLNTGRILENKKREAIEARNLGEADNKILFTNMLNLPLTGPFVNNKIVMLYKGHTDQYSDYFLPFQAFVESLGYQYVFVAPIPYVPLDTTGVKMLLIGVFYGKDGEYFTPEELQTIRDFVNGGGVCIIITEFDGCYGAGGIDTVAKLLEGLKLDFTCPIDGDYHTEPFTDITPDPITQGVTSFFGACTGRFEVFGDGVSLISGIDSNGTGIYYTSVCKSPLGE